MRPSPIQRMFAHLRGREAPLTALPTLLAALFMQRAGRRVMVVLHDKVAVVTPVVNGEWFDRISLGPKASSIVISSHQGASVFVGVHTDPTLPTLPTPVFEGDAEGVDTDLNAETALILGYAAFITFRCANSTAAAALVLRLSAEGALPEVHSGSAMALNRRYDLDLAPDFDHFAVAVIFGGTAPRMMRLPFDAYAPPGALAFRALYEGREELGDLAGSLCRVAETFAAVGGQRHFEKFVVAQALQPSLRMTEGTGPVWSTELYDYDQWRGTDTGDPRAHAPFPEEHGRLVVLGGRSPTPVIVHDFAVAP